MMICEFAVKENMLKLSDSQRVFVANMMVRDLNKIQKITGMSEDEAWKAYIMGYYGGDREIDVKFQNI